MVKFATWKEWLAAKIEETGSWACSHNSMTLSDFDAVSKMTRETFISNVNHSNGESMVLVVEGKGKVRAFHNLKAIGQMSEQKAAVGPGGSIDRQGTIRQGQPSPNQGWTRTFQDYCP